MQRNRLLKLVPVLVLVIGSCLVASQLIEVRSLQQQLQEKKQQLNKIERSISVSKSEIEDSWQLRSNQVKVEQIEVTSFLSNVERLITKSGVELKELAPQSKVRKSGFVKLPISLSLVGHYQKFIKFLTDLEGLQQVIRIEDMKLNVYEDKLQAKLKISLYALDESNDINV
ncbi:hypothetical protein JCM16358_09310 [Halanaerocella petrolearia]